MDAHQKLQLQNMISANNVEDQTELIRQLKHSEILEQETNTMIFLKAKHRNNAETLHLEAMQECRFLFTYYTDIYNKILKDELDLNIFFAVLNVLKEIENGELDQHTGSFKVGNLLKEMYVDSALKKAENAENAEKKGENAKKEENPENKEKVLPLMNIHWKEFKQNSLLPKVKKNTKTNQKKK